MFDAMSEQRDRQVRAIVNETGFTRRGVVKTGLVGAAMLGGGSLLTACTDSSGGGGAAAPTKAVRGGTLTVAMMSQGQNESVNVWQVIELPGYARVMNLYDPLFAIGPDGLEPVLAETMEPNSDATVWTLTLRQGVTWHNGKPLTADDVVYSIKNWLNPDNYYSYTISSIMEAKGVRKLDDRTVEVSLLRPVAEFPSFTTYIHCYIIPEGTTLEQLSKNPIGTGPFVFESFVPGGRSVFKANPNYWVEGRPYVDELIIDSSFTSDEARVSAVQSGSASTAPQLPWGLARANESNSGIRISSTLGASGYEWVMNHKRSPFTDVNVTQAMRLLTDRQALIDGALAGYGSPGNDLPGRGLKYHASDLVRERDVDQARFLLKKAGMENMSVTLDTSPGYAPGAGDAATLFAAQAAEAGVKVDVKRVDPTAFYEFTSSNGGRPFFFSYPGGGLNIPSLSQFFLNTMWSGAAYPVTQFGNPQDDKLLFDAIGELDEAKAEEKWHEVQRIQFERGGYIHWADMEYVDGYQPSVGGLDASFGGWNSAFQYKHAFVGGGK